MSDLRPLAQQASSADELRTRETSSTTKEATFRIVCARIVQVVLPVTLCASYCVLLIRVLSPRTTNGTKANLLNSTWAHLGVHLDGDSSTSLSNSFLIVLVFSLLIVSMTIIILVVFYMALHRYLIYYFYLPSTIILAIVTPCLARVALQSLNYFPADLYTVLLITWNFTILGLMAIFGVYAPTPLCVQQFYLIHNSAMLSVLIIQALPGWAPWILLTFMVIWDLFAVLAPWGPLKLIINIAEKEGIDDMPGLIYSTDIATTQRKAATEPERAQGENSNEVPAAVVAREAANKQVGESNTEPEQQAAVVDGEAHVQASPQAHKDTERVSDGGEGLHGSSSIVERGVSIGLGDFVFYSLLVGLTATPRQDNFYPFLATLNAVHFGLILTLLMLAFTGRALPALPISVALGLTAAAVTTYFVPPLSNSLASESIFV